MKKMQRLLASLLTFSFLMGLLPAEIWAVTPEQDTVPMEKPTQILTGSGETVEIGEDWTEKYPYGAFAFAESEASLEEGGDTLTIPIYRMGGDTGRATVYILFDPLVTPLDEEGNMGYGCAAGFDDLTIEAEDTLPIARFQPLGKDPDPEPSTVEIIASVSTDEEAEEGDLVLTLDTKAEAWQWYVLYQDSWQRIEDGTEPTLLIGSEDREVYDFRCVYTADGTRYCSVSLNGEVCEEPEEEILEPAPDDIDLTPPQTFTPVSPAGEDPSAPTVFSLTFADGEWVKFLRIRAKEDALAEPVEFASFTLIANEGGEIFRDAGTMILSVADNDEAEPFTIGFELTETEADKADGSVTLTVVRSGGGQTPVTVTYSTADDTALAGRDYERVSGELFFYADYDRQTITIPLIDDGAADSTPRSFTVELGEIRGNGAALGSLGTTETTVRLTNSDTAERRNLATILSVTGRAEVNSAALDGEQSDTDTAADASARAVIGAQLRAADDVPVSGTQVKTEADELMRGTYSLDAVETDDGLQTYQYGAISFSPTGGQYWDNYAYIAGNSRMDYTGWNGGHSDGSGWILKDDDNAQATLTIPHMAQLYDYFSGRAEFEPEWATEWDQFWHKGAEFVYGKVRVQQSIFTSLIDCTSDNIHYYTSLSLNTPLDIADTGNNSVALILQRYDDCGSDDDAWTKLTEGRLSRRVFNQKLNLTIHTANDGENGSGNIRTSPDGMAELTAASGVYESMKPVVTVVPNKGGVNSSGRLYVGSQIRVSLQNTASYFPYSSEDGNADAGEKLNTAIYLTRKDGSVVNAAVEPGGNNDYTVTLFWDTLSAADLNDTYTINVVMTRKQTVNLDLTPSVPRRVDKDGTPSAEIDTEKVPEALNTFWQNGRAYITVGRSVTTAEAPHFRTIIQTKLYYSLDGKVSDPLKTLGTLENVQYINFNRSPEDFIVFHGRVYKGNDEIRLSAADLASAELNFLYYNKDYITSESVMTASVDRVAVYWDGNCNGRIDGTFNADTGYFILDESSGDTLFQYLDKGDSRCETLFQPTKDENGTHEFIAKIFYTMTPRSINSPAEGGNARAQVLPALTTTVTDAVRYGELTEEEQSYRYLRSGQTADGRYTADGHLMYGEAATAVQYVDVPLGGDYSPAGEGADQQMAWSPDYHGHLLMPFADPEPIVLKHSMMGDDYPLSEFELDSATGTVTVKDTALLNGYLGSFAGSTTIALCPMEQRYSTDLLPSHPESLKPESSTLIERSVYPDPGDSMMLTTAEDNQPSAGFDEMEDNPFPEFNINANLHNSGFTASLPAVLGMVNFLYTKDSIQLIFTIPLVSWTKGKGVRGGLDLESYDKLWDQFKNVQQAVDTFDGDALRSALENKDGTNGPEGGSLTSKSLSVSLSFTGVVVWKYNNIDNSFVLEKFGFGVLGGIAFKVQQRFTPFPLAYVYFKLNFNVTMIGSFENVQTKVLSSFPIVSEDNPVRLKKGEVFMFNTSLVYAELEFTGKVAIGVYNSSDDLTPLDNGKNGYMKSDGGEMLVKFFTEQGPGLPDGQRACIRFTALEDTVIKHLHTVRYFTRDLHFAGLEVDPKLTFEGGIGCGIELVKVEAFVRAIFSASMYFAPYDKKSGSYGEILDFKQFQIIVGLGVNLVAIAFNFSLDAIEGVFTYDGATEKWSATWKSAYGPALSLSTEPGLPQDFSDAEPNRAFVFTSEENAAALGNDVDLEAYNTYAPFQVSGYGGSSGAFPLIEKLPDGYDYRIVSANGENYVFYTVGRRNAGALERSMLVMSRLVATGSTPGLVNPINAADRTPYIVVDDDTGSDLEFSAWAEDGVIRTAWVSYSEAAQGLQSLNANALFQNAAKSRVVKTAVFDTAGSEGFTDLRVIGDAAGGMVFLPAAAKDAVAYIEADAMSEEAHAEALEKYKAMLKTTNYDPDSTEINGSVGAYRLQVQEALWNVSGGVNRLTLWDKASDTVVSSELAPGVIVDSLEFAKIGDGWYLAFTTTEQVFLTAEDEEALTADEIADMVTIRRLCLKRIGTDGEKGTTYVLRTVYDRERNDDEQLEGIYAAGETEAVKDPGFANLRFLNARLGSALGGVRKDTAENFLLFEMNGCTYVVREGDLVNLADGGSGEILPFFTGSCEPDTQGSVPGRTAVTIGSDGDGGLAAVYVSSVPGTGNNALYISRYDSDLGWGSSVMLAMNHMNVYEQSVREGWDEENTAEQYRNAGLDQFRFGSVQIALGTQSEKIATSEEVVDKSASASEREPTLLLMTQGTYDTLKRSATDSGAYYPDPSGSSTHTGLYVIHYGIGQQALGEGSIRFAGTDFTAGALLHAVVKFKNTGDVSIRGSEDQPVTVRLAAEGPQLSSTVLAEWIVTDSILPGEQVSLSGEFELPLTLPNGTKLNLSVSEDTGYSDQPFSAILQDLLTIEAKPELGFADGVKFTPNRSTTSGSAVYDVDFTIENRGRESVMDVKVQFSYNTGEKDENGKAIYAPIDISSHTFSVGEEQFIQLNENPTELRRGIFHVGSFRTGFGHRVTGTLTIEEKYFETLRDGKAEVRVEIFSSADTYQAYSKNGMLTAGVRGEYNVADNTAEISVSHATFFHVPERLTIPLGVTLHLPVRYTATDSEPSHILVAEFPQTERMGGDLLGSSLRFQRMDQHISELYYEENAYTNGEGIGSVVITPLEEGSSYIRIMDLQTNDFVDIACEVTEGEGLNVFSGSSGAGIFTFLNADGSEYRGNGTSQSWEFDSGITAWGADGSEPYRQDLALGRTGASFRFDTAAESMKLVFNGVVRVESTLPGFEPVTLSAKGGTGRSASEAAEVVFGSNAKMMTHTVTVTVEAPAAGMQFAQIDWLAEHYSGDSHSPSLYWSSNFPQPGCAGEPVSLMLHAVDDRMLTDLWAETDGIATAGAVIKDGSDHWILPLTIRQNGTLTLHARDSAGNHSVTELEVDWFGSGETANNSSDVPAPNVWTTSSVVLLGSGEGARYIVAEPAPDAPEDCEIKVTYLGTDSDGAVDECMLTETPGANGAYRAAEDGLYLVKAIRTEYGSTDEDYAYCILRSDGTVKEEGNGATRSVWTAEIIRVEGASELEPEPEPDPEPTPTPPGSLPTVPDIIPPEKDETAVSEDGTVAEISYNAADEITGIIVRIDEQTLENALELGTAITAPVTIPGGQSGPTGLPVIQVEMPAVSGNIPAGQLPQLSFPVTGADETTVAFIRDSDGNWTPVRDCRLEDGMLFLPIEGPCELVIGSNAKVFPDVPADAWFARSVAFVTARGIFNGTNLGFEPEGTMTRAMVVQMLYNFDRRSVPGKRADFIDVSPDAWYADAVGWAAEEGIVQGYLGYFRPDAPISRQDLVTILYRYAKAAGYPIAEPADFSSFRDADDVADYAREPMGWAIAVGLINGMGDGTLAPRGTATRAQAAKIMQVFVNELCKPTPAPLPNRRLYAAVRMLSYSTPADR